MEPIVIRCAACGVALAPQSDRYEAEQAFLVHQSSNEHRKEVEKLWLVGR